MRSCARVVIVKDNKLLVMKRFKMGATYYTLLGGSVEEGEHPSEAAVREVMEESTVAIKNPRLVFIEDAGDPFGLQYVYLCEYVGGEPVLPDDSEEAFWSTPGKNTYEPMWLPISDLVGVPFVSELLKTALLKAFRDGFPEEPFEFSAKHARRLS